MSDASKGHKLCISCFNQRKKNAKKSKTENIMSNNWGLFLIPIVSPILLAKRASKCDSFPDGYDYHVYINGWHEERSKKLNNAYCNECRQFTNVYYELEDHEIDYSNIADLMFPEGLSNTYLLNLQKNY